INLKQWAREQGIHPVTAYRWFQSGKLPVPARRVGHLILVDAPARSPAGVTARSRVLCGSASRSGSAGGACRHLGSPGGARRRIVTEVGSALNGKHRKFLTLRRDPTVTTIVVEHRDRFARFGAEEVEAALAAQGRRLVVVDPSEVDDDLVRDVTEILTSLCARLYGRVPPPIGRPGRWPCSSTMARRYAVPDGWTLQAFQFALDPTPEQWQTLRRQWGGRRYAGNWAVRTLKADLEAYHATGESREPPSFYGLRWRWNRAKATECVDGETGEAWWPQISKEAFANGIKDAVDAYWRWQQSRGGELDGRRVGFPRFKRKGRDPDRCTFSTGVIRVEPDRRHVTLPKIGTVRTCESTRRLERLIRLGRARILAATLKRVGERAVVVFRVEIQRPQGCPTRPASWGAPQRGHPDPASTVGVDVGVRWLATVATAEAVIERVPNPAPLARNLTVLRRLSRSISRSQRGSNRCRRKERRRAKLHARIAAIRRHEIHRLTTRLAKTHGRIVVEGLDAAGMLRQKGLSGARARRRGLADSALAEVRRQLRYKTGWYGSELVEADQYFPSSKTCHRCG